MLVLIAIPLSLGIALASGAPLVAGLIAAVVGGIVVGAISGAPLQVTGPAAGLVVVVAELISRYGWPATAGIVLAAGVVQIGLGLLRTGQLALSLSPAVVHGMLAGIGIILVISQVHVLLGGSPEHSAVNNLVALPEQLMNGHGGAVGLGVFAIAVLLGWKYVPKLNVIPAPLIAVVLTTVAAVLTQSSAPRVALPNNPLDGFQFPQLPAGSLLSILGAVLTVALVASVESLLSALAVDKLHDGPRARLNKELIAQGVGNVVSGAVGGLPVTGVIVRSSANVAAGAQSRASTILHGVWIAAAVGFGAAWLEWIPLAALAAVLIVVGVRLIDIDYARTLLKHHELSVFLITVCSVVILGLMYGVLIGIAAAILRALWRLTHSVVRIHYVEPGRWHASIHGTLVFLGAGHLLKTLKQIPAGQHVHCELHTDFIDHAIFEAISDWREEYERHGGRVDVEEVHDSWFAKGHAGAPDARKTLPSPLPRWFAPWSYWQDRNEKQKDSHTYSMVTGVKEFQRRSAGMMRPFFRALADGQEPDQLFITCADSRIVPNLITSSGPGDLFCVRNVGNFVPRAGTDTSMGAAIEFALNALGVTSIVVCGHSNCGAMRALLSDDAQGVHLRHWLKHGKTSLTAYQEGDVPRSLRFLAPSDRLAISNVQAQLINLRTYNPVQQAISKGHVTLIGLYFDIATAHVYLVEENGELAPFDGPSNATAEM